MTYLKRLTALLLIVSVPAYGVWLLFPATALADPSVDVSTNAEAVSGVLKYNMTVTAGTSNVLIVVGASLDNGVGASGAFVSSVKDNGALMTNQGTTTGAANAGRTEQTVWTILATSTGNQAIAITMSTTYSSIFGVSAAVKDANPTTPVRGYSGASCAVACSAISTTITSVPGDLVLDTVCNGSNVTAPSLNQKQLQLNNLNANTTCDNAGSSSQVGAPSVMMSWTSTGVDEFVDSAISVEPAPQTNAVPLLAVKAPLVIKESTVIK